MNILYIGYKDEYDADLLLSLSKEHKVSVLSKKESSVETNCEFIIADNIVNKAYYSDNFDLVVLRESEFSSEELNSVFDICVSSGIKKLVALRHSPFFADTESSLDINRIVAQQYSENHGLNVTFVKLPCLYGHTPPEGLIEICADVLDRSSITLRCGYNYTADLLIVDDFCKFFSAWINDLNSVFEHDSYTLNSSYPFEISRLVKILNNRYNEPEITFEKRNDDIYHESKDVTLTAPSRDGLDDINKLLDASENYVYKKGLLKKKKIGNTIMKTALFLLFFGLIACYTIIAPPTAELQFVDVRLIFLVFSALILGKNYGYLSAALCGVLLIAEKLFDGYTWYTLFYNVNNWITIVIYIVCAMIIGMFLTKREKK